MSDIVVPEGLVNLLRDLALNILKKQPSNLIKFAADYFNKLVEEETVKPESATLECCPLDPNICKLDPNMCETNRSPISVNVSHPSEQDSEFEEMMQRQTNAQSYGFRRRSVAAEHYNPDSDKEILNKKLSSHEKTAEQLANLKEVCRKIVIFNELDEKEIESVVMAMFERNVVNGEDIIQENDDGDNFYIIESGKYVAKISDSSGNEEIVKEYDNFGYFGELALMYNAPRSATITAMSDGVLWALNRDSFKKLVLGHEAQLRRDFIAVLHSVTILTDLTSQQQMALADSLKRNTVNAGECIIKEGDPGKEIYFVMTGTVVVKKLENGTQKELTKIEKGGYFGELSLLRNTPRAASVFAETEVSLAVLGVESFERLLGPCIDLMRRNASIYASPGHTEI